MFDYNGRDWEVMADAMEEAAEWMAYEADMTTMPPEIPSDADMEAMAEYFGEA